MQIVNGSKKANSAMNGLEPYLRKFEKFERETKQPSWVFPLRKAGIARFAELGFPTLNDEDWRFTNVAPIAKLPFSPAFTVSRNGLSAEDVQKLTFGNLEATRLVFLNGHLVGDLSAPVERQIRVTSLASALAGDSQLLEKHLAQYAITENNAFTALNTAFFEDGAFIHVPANVTVERPIHLLFLSSGPEAGVSSSPRNLVIAEKGSQLTLVESYASLSEAAYFTNAVTELVIGEGAVVEHCKFQDESMNAFHMAAIHARLERRSNFISHSIAVGSRLSRNNIRTSLSGEGLECILNGLYLTQGEQLADHHMVVEHAQPHCNSHEYYNGILDGRSKGVFHGRILVREAAQKTDAKQTNKNLLLSDDATADTKPQLEIYADDVKCTHGATVGQLNEESIFYLRARGIGADTARRMLIHAFAGEIIDRIRYLPAREELDKIVWERLERNSHFAQNK
jgi:Fe-S cluster assembly protein SufD